MDYPSYIILAYVLHAEAQTQQNAIECDKIRHRAHGVKTQVTNNDLQEVFQFSLVTNLHM